MLGEAADVGDEGGHQEHVPRQGLFLLLEMLHLPRCKKCLMKSLMTGYVCNNFFFSESLKHRDGFM